MVTSISSSLQAFQAYGGASESIKNRSQQVDAAAAKAAAAITGGNEGVADTSRSSPFVDLVGQSLQHVEQVGDNAARVTRDHLAGNTSIVEAVAAISEAELTVQTVRSVRDRMVAAYQEIARMPI